MFKAISNYSSVGGWSLLFSCKLKLLTHGDIIINIESKGELLAKEKTMCDSCGAHNTKKADKPAAKPTRKCGTKKK